MKKTRKIQFDKKSTITGFVLFFLLLFVTISCAVPQPMASASFSEINQTLDQQMLLRTNDLKEEGKVYKSTGIDTHLVYKLPAVRDTVSIAIQVSSDKDLMQSDNLSIYFAKNSEDFSQSRSAKPYFKTDKDIYLFEIPADQYDLLRIDVNADFTMNQILLSDQPLQITPQKQPINLLRLLGAIVLPCLIIGVLFFTNTLSKLALWLIDKGAKLKRFAFKNKLNIIISFLSYLLILAVSIGLEFLYFRLVDKVPNSAGMHFDFYRFLFIFGVLATAFTLFLFRKVAGKKPEYLFLTIILIAGALLTAGQPPTNGLSWDDQIHFQWTATATTVTDGGYTKAEENLFNVHPDFKELQEYKNLNNYAQQQNQLHENGQIDSIKESPLNLYQRLGHLPGTITMKVCSLVDISFSTQIFLARMSNLFVYAIVMFLAIRKLSSGKMILSVIALLPTFVFLACNFSYDYWVTAFITLGFVYYLEEIRHPERVLEFKNLMMMLGLFIIGCGPKAIYFVFLFLPLFFQRGKIKNYKKRNLLVFGSLVFVVGSLALTLLLTMQTGGDIRGGSDVNSTQQILYILRHPIEYAITLIKFLFVYWNPEGFIVSNKYFTNFAYYGASAGSVILICLLFVTAFTDKNDRDIHSSKPWFKFLIGAGSFAGTALVATTLYISFTAVGSSTVAGCQLRYLFPFLFPVFSVIGSCKIKNAIKPAAYNYAIIGVSGSILFLSIWQQVLTFYH